LEKFGYGSGFGSGLGSGSRHIYHSFSKTNKIAQNLAFSISEAVYFPESGPLIFDFILLLLHILLDQNLYPFSGTGSWSILVTLRQKVLVPAVPVAAPAPQLWLAGLLKIATKSDFTFYICFSCRPLLFRYTGRAWTRFRSGGAVYHTVKNGKYPNTSKEKIIDFWSWCSILSGFFKTAVKFGPLRRQLLAEWISAHRQSTIPYGSLSGILTEMFCFCFWLVPSKPGFKRKNSRDSLLFNSLHEQCAADFSLLNLPKGKSLGRSKPATNS
jgi:hypothetical protein